MSKMKNYILRIYFKFFSWLPDELYLRILYRIIMHKWLHLNPPISFSEKLQWLKLYNRKPEYTVMVDKYAVKEYVANTIGEQYVISQLGVWSSPEEIDFESLPNQFVLKTTFGGGGNCGIVICRDKTTFNYEDAIKRLRIGMKQNFYKRWREWPYKNVPRRIIAEKYIQEENLSNNEMVDLADYKFYCFHGEPKYILIVQGRYCGVKCYDYFDIEWNHLPVCDVGGRNADKLPPRPSRLDEMLKVARKLSENIPHVRIDLYNIENKVYFGEMTFFEASGFAKYNPEEYENVFSSYLKIDKTRCDG